MADEAAPPPAPKEGEIQINVAELNRGEEGAANALTALFDEGAPPDQPDGESQSADAGAPEKAPTGDNEDGHSEPPATGAIEPPASWTADEKQQFDALPPEAKKAIEPFLRRDRERDALLSTQSRKTAEETQKFQTLRTQAETERAQQTQFFQSIALQLTPELQRFQNLDWTKLAAEQPAEWAKQSQAYADVRNRHDAAMQAASMLGQQQQAEVGKRREEFLTKERALLVEKIPEFADPLKGKAFADDIVRHVSEFTPDEWKGAVDHRYFTVARDAMLWRKAEAARKSAQTKRAQPAPSNVRTLRPAARPEGTAASEGEAKQFEALHGKLAKTGSIRDAQALLTRVLG